MVKVISKWIGPIAVVIECPVRYASVFVDNFCGAEELLPGKVPDLHLVLHEGHLTSDFDADFDAGKNFRFKRGCFSFTGPQFTATVDGLFSPDRPCRIDVWVTGGTGVARLLVQAARSAYSSLQEKRVVVQRIAERVASTVMSYYLFWFVMHGVLLKKHASFIHASALERDGRVMLLAGTGGCGKTSTTFRMLEDNSLSYLAEDFTILSVDGNVFFNPKTLSIYASDLRGEPRLLINYAQSHLAGPERRAWFRCREHGGVNPMRKVPPVQVLGKERLCMKAHLGIAFFLVRGNFDSIAIQAINESKFAERSMNASFRELKMLSEIVVQGWAVARAVAAMPTIEEFRAELKGNIEKAVMGCPCYLLQIPRQADPRRVARFLTEMEW